MNQGSQKTYRKAKYNEKSKMLINEDQADKEKFEIFIKYGITETRRKVDLIILIFITFMGMICYSVVLPSISVYLEELGAKGTYLGYAVASYSIGAVFSNPCLGWLADKFSTKKVLLFSLSFCFFGNVAYALCEPVKSKWLLLTSRFVVGMFAGSNSVVRAHISEATTMKDRTFWMTMNTIGGTLGFICGPALSLGLSTLNIRISEKFFVNAYTSPGYLNAIVVLFLYPVMIFGFMDIPYGAKQEAKKFVEDVQVDYPKVPFLSCIMLNFVNVLCLATFETVTTPFTKHLYHYSVFDNGILYTGLGVVCVVAFVVLVVLDRVLKIDNRVLNIGSIFVMFIGFSLLIRDPDLSQYRMWLGMAFIAFGYSPASALIVSIFSKVIPQTTQGLKMGAFSSVSSLARIGGPILSSLISQYVDYNAVWLIMQGILIMACIFHIFIFQRLKPIVVTPPLEINDYSSDQPRNQFSANYSTLK